MKLSNIMKSAWAMYRAAGCTTRAEFGLALRAAWDNAKLAAVRERARNTPAAEGMIIMSYTAFEKAFKAKYPQGSFTKPVMFQNNMKIQFTPDGKVYTYAGRYDTVAQKLGLIKTA